MHIQETQVMWCMTCHSMPSLATKSSPLQKKQHKQKMQLSCTLVGVIFLLALHLGFQASWSGLVDFGTCFGLSNLLWLCYFLMLHFVGSTASHLGFQVLCFLVGFDQLWLMLGSTYIYIYRYININMKFNS